MTGFGSRGGSRAHVLSAVKRYAAENERLRSERDSLLAEVARLRDALAEVEYLADCGMAVTATKAARTALSAAPAPSAGAE